MRISEFMRRQWMTVALVAVIPCVFGGDALWRALQIPSTQSLPMEGKAYNFTLESSNGQSVSLSDTTGKIRLVSFIYTRCNASCPVVTSQMSQLQTVLKQEGLFGKAVELMSVTMDPAYDTASVLANYGQQFHATPSGWSFLTGAQKSIRLTLQRYGVYAQPVGANQYVHTTAEFLIDGQGNIRKIYGVDLSAQNTVKDIQTLLHQRSLG